MAMSWADGGVVMDLWWCGHGLMGCGLMVAWYSADLTAENTATSHAKCQVSHPYINST
jgi:hypothetical protein